MGTATRQKNKPNEKTSVHAGVEKQEDAADRVRAALTANPGSTVVDIAAFACVAKSTASRLLTNLEQDGHARRARHEGRHEPDTWYSTGTNTEAALNAPDHDTAPGSAHQPETPASETAEVGNTPSDTTDVPKDTEPAAPTSAGDAPNETAESGTTPDPVILPSGQPKLRSGALRDLVAEHLAAHPNIAFTPTELSHKLDNRSSGAIANALDKLTASGHATQVCERPRRFQATTGTDGPDADAA